ncbi:CPLN2 protein, partial [Himantopus himantopus]|nr:CPLN2 protein [Himantopus himantopus]
PGWLLSPAGRPYRDSILQRNQRRAFGECVSCTLGTARPRGEAGGGGTTMTTTLSAPPMSPGGDHNIVCLCHPPPGIEATTVYWPAKPRASGRPVIFQLRFWD